MDNSDAKKCYVLEDRDAGLACVKKVIENYEGSCKPKLVLLVQEKCPHCSKEKEIHKADIEKGIIKQIDVDSEEGLDIAVKNGLSGVPALLLVDCRNQIIE